MLTDSQRVPANDKKFDADETDSQYSNYMFLRLVARRRRFRNVNFRYSIFDSSYLRDCVFDSCDFTGCRFVGTNLSGSRFSGCKFEYVIFERTYLEPDLLDTECPSYENQKARFARTLRTNFQQIGNAIGANKAMAVELQATEIHLHKAWRSTESYYRKKYTGWHRFQMFIEWCRFKTLHYIWGNGESASRLVASIVAIGIVASVADTVAYRDLHRLDSYWQSLKSMPAIFLGVDSPVHYPKSYLASITFIRLVVMGFFLSIIIKRFNRR